MRLTKRELEQKRMEYGEWQIIEAGYDVSKINRSKLQFEFKEETVYYFPYTGWFSGKSVRDGRGIKNLIKQIKK